MNFKEIYKSATDDLKKEFLDLLVVGNKEREKQFIEFWKKTVSPKKDKVLLSRPFASLVEKNKEIYLSVFESIDLQPDFDSCHNSSYYRDDWEIVQDEGGEQIDTIFEDIKAELLDLFLLQDIESFISTFVGLNEACVLAEIEDEYYAYEDVNDELINQFGILTAVFSEKIDSNSFDEDSFMAIIKALFDYIEWNPAQEAVSVELFEPLLLAFAGITKQAKKFFEILNNSTVKQEDVPQLWVKLLQLSFEDNRWIGVALNQYQDNKGIAIQLLEYYYEHSTVEFVLLAKELLVEGGYKWPVYLEDKVSVQQDKDLYFRVFKALAISQSSLNHYLKIRDLFDAESFALFSQELRYNKLFLVEILEYEKDYEAIKLLVKQTEDGDGDFDKLIKPILNIYPDFCFNAIRDRLNRKIKKERGRDYYYNMAVTLLLTKQIKGYHQQYQNLILKLYNYKPNLPALKDEFRKLGLM